MLSERLREETYEAHVVVEKLLVPRIKNLDSANSYSRLLRMFYGYFKPVEEKIEQYLSPRVVSDIEARRKAETILEDIRVVGETDHTVLCHDLPVIENAACALGAMYVLEGSTLGGKFISKMIAEKLELGDNEGLRFFTGYGSESALKWNSFKEVLNNYTDNGDVENEVIEAANQTFSKFKNWIELN